MKHLIEKKNDLITRAEEIVATAKAEKRELTDAEAQEIAEIKDDVRKIKETLGLDKDVEDMAKDKEVADDERACDEEKRSIEAQERASFEAFIRGQINERSGELTPASGSGQAIIPTSIANEIIKKVYNICPILELL